MKRVVTELERFRVLPEKEAVVKEWMDFLNEYLPDVLLTLEQEKMYVEAIFQEEEQGVTYLYWFSVQGENPVAVEESNFEVDKKHMAYWQECIDPAYRSKKLTPKVVMIPEKIHQAIQEDK
ncbi:DUF6176 family protein [Vagococcus entomophilus]|uniref:Uncharacterized protein n=1 Tax=Vagococcus entomophilus TaxID=1160095 RepID=A0A430AGS5_9ENTE|nr:DUF6176 family protein [Vagococcus entomophilus]RSU07047.1 hypothetical protein CBF30_07255 [Vagococcus entomophilus]